MMQRLAFVGTMRRMAAVLALGVATMALPGCATHANHGDPMESWNRKVFAFNEQADAYVLKPVAQTYKDWVPEPVRFAFNNVSGNIKDMWSTVNLFLQGRPREGAMGIIRVSINTTFGLLGTIDMASAMQIDRQQEDFGQTLGVWGVGPGPYIVWPFLGSSTLRDTFDLPGDWYFSVSTLGTYPRESNLLTVADKVRLRANLLDAGDLIDDVALDKYAFLRNAYLQRRLNLIYEGEPPEDSEPPLVEDPPGAGVPKPAPTSENGSSAPQ